jgi:CBS domain-containing protein
MKRLVKDLIRQRGLLSYKSVSPKTAVLEALNILETTKSSALLVTENNQLVGIFSEKDFALASMKHGIQLSAKVCSAMTSKVYYVEPAFTLEECLQVMLKIHVRHLPVLEDGRPIALISMRHIMEVLIEDKEAQIRELTTYITGSGVHVGFTSEKQNQKVPIYSTAQS